MSDDERDPRLPTHPWPGRSCRPGRVHDARDLALDGIGVTPQEVAISATVNWRESCIRWALPMRPAVNSRNALPMGGLGPTRACGDRAIPAALDRDL